VAKKKKKKKKNKKSKKKKKKKKWPVQKMSKSMTMDMKEGVRQ